MIDQTESVGDVIVSRETLEKLKRYGALIEKWTKSINLIAPATVSNIWNRHIVDSAQVFSNANPNWTHWIDLGSGGGLPGLVVAILDQNRRPVTLVESDTRKALFLNTVRRELNLNVTVMTCRIEDADPPKANVVSARALAPLTKLLSFAEPLLTETGSAYFLKGARFQEELDDAHKTWQFDCAEYPSITNSDARVLEISGIKRREA